MKTKLTCHNMPAADGKTDFPRALRAWVESRPELKARAFVPVSFKFLRRKLGCPAGHGGKRPPPRKAGYSVAGRGRAWGAAA
jgi:hypothetical protein